MLSSSFTAVFKHLREYSWIYDFNNTKVFSDTILDNIPPEWESALLNLTTQELNDIPYGFTKSEWPKSLIEYIEYTTKLSSPRHRCNEGKSNSNTINIPDTIKKGMSPKKLIEVKYLSALVEQLCMELRCYTVLDIGCGLGYLDQVLHHNFGYKVIGVDSESNKCRSAIKRAKAVCNQNIHYYNMEISENSFKELNDLLSSVPSFSPCRCGHNAFINEMDENRILMLSLHSCGDLTPNMLRLYIEIPNIVGIINVGCCYHVMRKDETDTHFINFPLSKEVREAYKEVTESFPTWKVSHYGFRLAAQETRARWKTLSTEEHENHSKYVAYRAMLQVYLERNGVIWKRSKRHLVKKRQIDSFDEYIEVVINSIHYEFFTRQEAIAELKNIYSEFLPKVKTIEIFTLLQVLLQPLWEIVIVYDRCIFLQENGMQASVLTTVDESVSPRNLAIIAIKPR